MITPSEMVGTSTGESTNSLMNRDMNESNTTSSTSRSGSPILGKHHMNQRFERLKLENDVTTRSVPSIPHAGDFAVEETDEDEEHYAKNLEGLNSAKAMLRKLSSASSEHPLKSNKSHFEFTSTAYDVRMLSKDISNTRVNLEVENLMIIVKKNEVSLVFLLRELVEWIITNYPNITIYVQDTFENSEFFAGKEICTDTSCKLSKIRYWNEKFVKENDLFFDLCITLGGDGTVLFASTLFQRHVPPILPFALGSLGFLTNFDFESFKFKLPTILNQKVKTNLRMRLDCKVFRRHPTQKCPETGKKICYVENVAEHHVLNEITIDRGPSPYISMLELYGDDSLMTVAQADGLIIATPTGSTAYSLSAGGSLIYPSVNAIAVTPVCPHTLSFRPIVLPDSIKLKVKVPLKSRGTAWVAFDGKNRVELAKGDYVTISASPYIFPTIESSPTEFIDGINRTMNWNVREQQKSFTHMLSRKNRERFATQVVPTESSEEDVEEQRIRPGQKTGIILNPLSDEDDSETDSDDAEEHCCNEIHIPRTVN